VSKPTSFRLSDPIKAKIAWIADTFYNGNQTTAVTAAVERMFATERSTMDKRNQTTLADAIYAEVFGHLDDKRFRAAKVQEIYDWLEAGDLDDKPDVANLAAEWREYDVADVAANRP
jgi:hypothetical protein